MAKEVKLPQISEGVDSAEVTEVLVSEGDTVEKEQSIIAVETDKASVEVPSSDSGKVKEIKVKEGDEIKVGDVILVLEGDGEEEEEPAEEEEDKEKDTEKKKSAAKEEAKSETRVEEKAGKKEEKEEKPKAKKEGQQKEEEEKEKEKQKEEPEEEQKQEPKKAEKQEKKTEAKETEEPETEEEKTAAEAKEQEQKKEKPEKEEAEEGQAEKPEKKEAEEPTAEPEEIPASPGVRRMAREMGLEIRDIEGTGEGGRITEEDVKSYAGKQEKKDAKQPFLPDFSQWGEVERKPLSRIRKAIAENTSSSWHAIPHVTHFDEADITGIEEYRKNNSQKAEEAGGKLTVTAILVKIAANALQRFPVLNASIDMEKGEVILKKYVHIGIAVDTEKGLLVPVIRDVDKKSLLDIAVEMTELSEKARNQQLSPEDMQGGSFVVSNLGGIGGTNFTPIVYHPQVAILGISKAKVQPVYIEENFEPRQILPLSLSYDHRLIDGAEGARFLRWIGQALEDPYKALLEV